MAEKLHIPTLRAEQRNVSRKAEIKRLRAEGYVPAVFYMKEQETISLQFKANELRAVLAQRPALINIAWAEGDYEDRECMIRELQRHPVTGDPLHMDLIGITRGVAIETTVPIELVGTAPGVKEGGILQQPMNSVMVSCMPRHIPRVIEVDVSHLNMGDSIHLNEIEVENVEWADNPDRTVASVVYPRMVEEEEEEDEEGELLEGEEGEAEGEDAEGEAGESEE